MSLDAKQAVEVAQKLDFIGDDSFRRNLRMDDSKITCHTKYLSNDQFKKLAELISTTQGAEVYLKRSGTGITIEIS